MMAVARIFLKVQLQFLSDRDGSMSDDCYLSAQLGSTLPLADITR